MEKLYNITIRFDNLDLSFQMDIRKKLEIFKVNYNLDGNINILNANKELMNQLEIWDVKIKENK